MSERSGRLWVLVMADWPDGDGPCASGSVFSSRERAKRYIEAEWEEPGTLTWWVAPLNPDFEEATGVDGTRYTIAGTTVDAELEEPD